MVRWGSGCFDVTLLPRNFKTTPASGVRWVDEFGKGSRRVSPAPQHSGNLVCEGNVQHLLVCPLVELIQPVFKPVRLPVEMCDGGPGPTDDKQAQIRAPRLLIPSKVVVPPVEYRQGTNHDLSARSRALPKDTHHHRRR